MKLVVGLGNPGRKYDGTRHNVGFDVLDLLAGRHRLEWESAPADALIAKWRAESVLLAKPLTFMNLSGYAVGDCSGSTRSTCRISSSWSTTRIWSWGVCGRGRRDRLAATTA